MDAFLFFANAISLNLQYYKYLNRGRYSLFCFKHLEINKNQNFDDIVSCYIVRNNTMEEFEQTAKQIILN